MTCVQFLPVKHTSQRKEQTWKPKKKTCKVVMFRCFVELSFRFGTSQECAVVDLGV